MTFNHRSFVGVCSEVIKCVHVFVDIFWRNEIEIKIETPHGSVSLGHSFCKRCAVMICEIELCTFQHLFMFIIFNRINSMVDKFKRKFTFHLKINLILISSGFVVHISPNVFNYSFCLQFTLAMAHTHLALSQLFTVCIEKSIEYPMSLLIKFMVIKFCISSLINGSKLNSTIKHNYFRNNFIRIRDKNANYFYIFN